MKQIGKTLAAVAVVAGLSGCSVLNDWVYRIDIPQGNYLEQRDVDKLRVGMSQEQVAYVLGRPVAENSFNSERWVYVYDMNPNEGEPFHKELILDFEGGQLARLSGDFDKPENFDTPLEP